jgi:hypothetical protein
VLLIFSDVNAESLASNEYSDSTTNTCLHGQKQATHKGEYAHVVFGGLHAIPNFPKPFVHEVDTYHNKQGAKEKVRDVRENRKR